MKKWTLVLLILIGVLCFDKSSASTVEINSKNFPDKIFRKYISVLWDTNKDGKLSDEERNNVTFIYIDGEDVKSVKGVEFFKNLDTLNIFNCELTSLDISKNTALTGLNVSYNNITELNVSKNINLKSLSCGGNKLRNLDVSKNTKLEDLSCRECGLTKLDISNNPKIEYIWCENNSIRELNLKNNTALRQLICNDNELTALDTSNNKKLTALYCYNNHIANLDLSKNTKILAFIGSGNRVHVKTTSWKFDLTSIPGFKVSKIKEIESQNNCTIQGNNVVIESNGASIMYTYDVGVKVDIPLEVTIEFEVARDLVLPASLTKIESYAFANLTSIWSITIPVSVQSIAEDAFEGTNATLRVYSGSYAERWAKDHHMEYVIIK